MTIEVSDVRAMCSDLYPFEDLEPLEDSEQVASLLSSEMASHFTPVALLGSHGVVAVWKHPKGGEVVAWLDSEGSNWVIAEDLGAFCAMLPYSTGAIYDFCSSWENYDPEDEDSTEPAEKYSADELEAQLSEAKNSYPRHGELIAWLASKGISVDPNPLVTIGQAQKKHPVLQDWLDQHS